MKQEILVKVEHMNKRFGSTVALKDVSIEVCSGRVLGLIGENGSGKSTVTSIIAGMQNADSGTMTYHDKEWKPESMLYSLEHGIGMIVQETGTVPGITVAENIFLGETKFFKSFGEKHKWGPVKRKLLNQKAQEALDAIGASHIRAEQMTASLDLQERKLIEIARIMNKHPEVLVVDETTTALSQKGREIIYNIMEQMKKENKAVVFISHDLEEIMEKCDALTVLRDGNIIVTFDKSEFDEDKIKSSMIGRQLEGDYYRSDYDGSCEDEVVLEMKDVNLTGKLIDFNLQLHKGEILGMQYNAVDGSYSVSNVKPGLYVIAANKQVKEYSYSGNVVAVNYQYSGTGIASIADENGVIHVAAKKSSDPTMKKEVIENGNAYKYGDANIGDTVEFKITMTIPDYQGSWLSDKLHYNIKDSLTDGLTLDVSSIKLEGTSINDLFVTNKKCTSTNITTSTSGFTLDLYGEDVYQYAGNTIAITYQAKVNEKAKVNFDSDENKATLKYSTVASGTDMSDPMQDITHHYTFGFDTLVNGTGSEKTTEITKYGVKTTTELDNKVALDGAQFKLFDANGKQLYFTSDGEYTTETSGTYDYIVSKNNGQLTATGLDAGTYTLKESKAPLGYALDKTTYTIVITPTYNELTGELKNYTVRVNGATGNSITFTHEKLDNGTINTTDNAANADTFGINNTPLITLPETGGAGMIALTVAAVVLMAGFGTMFVSLRKRKQVK